MYKYIISDLYRFSGKKDINTLILTFFCNPFFRYQFYLRMSKCNNVVLRKTFILMKRLLSHRVNVQISSKVDIGYGLYIPHGNVVINSKTKIGNNCSIMQFTSIGSTTGKAAYIKDDVYLSPNSSIVGDVVINNGSVVGAGSVIVSNVQEYSVYVGVPGKFKKTCTDFIAVNRYKV